LLFAIAYATSIQRSVKFIALGKGDRFIFHAGSRPALPSSLDSKPGNPLYFIYESTIARQLAALQTLTEQGSKKGTDLFIPTQPA